MDKKDLCSKIIEIYPDIGECGIGVNMGGGPGNRPHHYRIHYRQGNYALS